jgi:hypothetical protein
MSAEYRKQQDVFFQEIEAESLRNRQLTEAQREDFVNTHNERDIARLARVRGISPEQARKYWRDLYKDAQGRED